jgi:hypothetical protein
MEEVLRGSGESSTHAAGPRCLCARGYGDREEVQETRGVVARSNGVGDRR